MYWTTIFILIVDLPDLLTKIEASIGCKMMHQVYILANSAATEPVVVTIRSNNYRDSITSTSSIRIQFIAVVP